MSKSPALWYVTDKIAFSGLVCAWQHMGKSLNMILMPIFEIKFLPNICSPYVWILYVALFDPIGSPLVDTLPQSNFTSLRLKLSAVWSSSRGRTGFYPSQIHRCA